MSPACRDCPLVAAVRAERQAVERCKEAMSAWDAMVVRASRGDRFPAGELDGGPSADEIEVAHQRAIEALLDRRRAVDGALERCCDVKGQGAP